MDDQSSLLVPDLNSQNSLTRVPTAPPFTHGLETPSLRDGTNQPVHASNKQYPSNFSPTQAQSSVVQMNDPASGGFMPPPNQMSHSGAYNPAQQGYQYGANPMQRPPSNYSQPGTNQVSKLSSDDPIASVPSMQDMDRLQGYETASFNGAAAPPPAYHEVVEAHSPERGNISHLPQITEDQAREALCHHVAEKCCYGKAAAIEMVFNSLEASSAFHYKLESFTERRETCWAYEPYTAQVIDSAHNGRPPSPWEIQVIAPKSFISGKADVEIPHTASVKKCHGCHGHGYKRCSTCHGRGFTKCTSCHARGYINSPDGTDRRCLSCNATGERRCYRCNGHGDICCHICESSGQLKCFISMTVTWTVHTDDYIVEKPDMPDKLIKSVSGQIALEEEQQRVWPVNHFPDASINQASSSLVRKHLSSYQSEKILMQRQQIRVIPVTQALYKWGNKDGRFYVYGYEQKVYAPDYPQKCCCCHIL